MKISLRSLYKTARRLSILVFAGLFACVMPLLAPHLMAQAEPSTPAADNADEASASPESPYEVVEVDWLEQIKEGGFTMVALGLVSLFGLAFTIERALSIRAKYFRPPALAAAVGRHVQPRDFEGLKRLSAQYPSTLGRIIGFLVDHRGSDYQKLTSMAENIGAREIIDHEERTFPLAVVAAVAPLLGLLGTMIGMIEAFQLVSIYGDEGGASMLAGSIAKALITTAAGLILAIPAICAFHYFKHKLHKIAVRLEEDLEMIVTGLFLTKSPNPEDAEDAENDLPLSEAEATSVGNY